MTQRVISNNTRLFHSLSTVRRPDAAFSGRHKLIHRYIRRCRQGQVFSPMDGIRRLACRFAFALGVKDIRALPLINNSRRLLTIALLAVVCRPMANRQEPIAGRAGPTRASSESYHGPGKKNECCWWLPDRPAGSLSYRRNRISIPQRRIQFLQLCQALPRVRAASIALRSLRPQACRLGIPSTRPDGGLLFFAPQ